METIRDAIKAQTEPQETGRHWYVPIVPIIAFVITRALGYRWNSLMGGLILALSLLLLVIAIVVTVLRRARRITCPVCGAPLGAYAFAMEDGPRHQKIDSCPNCGVNLDDPMPETPTPPEDVTTPDKLAWK